MTEQKRAAVLLVHSDGTVKMPSPGHLAKNPDVREAVGTYGIRNPREAEKVLNGSPRYKSVVVASSETEGQAEYVGDKPTDEQLAAVELEFQTRNDPMLAADVARLGARGFGGLIDPGQTESKALAIVRTKQDKFRKALERESAKCWITGASVYVASHIRPWKDAENLARVDPNNGLLLCPNYDALFNDHLIGFDENGMIQFGGSLSRHDRRALGIRDQAELTCDLTTGRKAFLKEHLDQLK